MYDLRIIHGQCYIDHEFKTTNLYIKDEKIAEITDDFLEAKETVDAQGLKVLPGFIDPHVHLHLNLGSTYSADDFVSGSHLAAMGGVTTVIDFLDPIYNNDELNEAFDRRLSEASGSIVDYSFHCTLANYEDDVDELILKVKEKGIPSIKVFTTYSDSNRRCKNEVIKKLLKQHVLTLAHSEDDEQIKACSNIELYEASRSQAAEIEAIQRLIGYLVDGTGRLYIVHVSSGHSLEKIEKVKNLYLESCPQYFYLSKDLYDSKGYRFLLAPPLRSKTSIDQMKKHRHMLDTIGTDHCSFKLNEKHATTHVDKIPKGIGSLGYAFQLMYDLFGDEIIPKFTSKTAEIFNLKHKGRIEIGCDADFALLNTHGQTVCDTSYSQSDYTVYDGMVLNNKIEMTIRRGDIIMSDHKIKTSSGKFVRRTYESNHQRKDL